MTFRKLIPILLATIALFCMAVPSAHACRRVVVRQGEDLVKVFVKPNKEYVIKNDIDLGGKKVIIGKGCTLVFKGGSLSNGTIVGNNTKINDTHNNIFRNCRIGGVWKVKCAFSTMFDNNIDAATLLRNLSCLSSRINLSANRNYYINENEIELDVETIEAASNSKPLVRFHTTNPDKDGLKIFGKNIVLRNIRFVDDYDEKNDAKYGINKHTIGNMIAVRSRDKSVSSLTVEGCDFSGGTSSSYVASSQTKNCLVKDCSFSGYIGDHAVYCSMVVENFVVKDCLVKNVVHTRGLFKIRSSDNAKGFTIQNLNVRNLNGYLANVSLLATPNCELLFDRIKVSKDNRDTSVFYGFCINDETKSISGKGYNANCIMIKNCEFGYGYSGAPVIYNGAGVKVRVKTIQFDNTTAIGSNFSGGNSDRMIVRNCNFSNCCGKNGIVLHARHVEIEGTKIDCGSETVQKCLFLVNYNKEPVETIKINDVVIDANTSQLFRIVKGDHVKVYMYNSEVNTSIRSVFQSPKNCVIDYVEDNNKIKKSASFQKIYYQL